MNEFVTIGLSFFVLLSILPGKLNRVSKLAIFGIVLFFILADGLRWQMGTDWQSYKDNYDLIQEKFTPGFDIGFEYFTLFMNSIHNNYSLYLFVISFFIFGVLFYKFKEVGTVALIPMYF